LSLQVAQRFAKRALRQHGVQLSKKQRFNLLKHRATLALALEQPIRRHHAFATRFDSKQRPDQSNEFADGMIASTLRLRQILFCLDHVTTRVRPTAQMYEPVLVGDIVVRLIAVSHHCRARLDASIERRGLRRAARRAVAEQSNRWTGAAHLRPHIALALRRAPGLLQHLHGRFIAIDDVGIEQMIAHQVDQRLHRRTDTHHAGSERATREIPAETMQQRSDSIQRQRVGELADDHPCKRRFRE